MCTTYNWDEKIYKKAGSRLFGCLQICQIQEPFWTRMIVVKKNLDSFFFWLIYVFPGLEWSLTILETELEQIARSWLAKTWYEYLYTFHLYKLSTSCHIQHFNPPQIMLSHLKTRLFSSRRNLTFPLANKSEYMMKCL